MFARMCPSVTLYVYFLLLTSCLLSSLRQINTWLIDNRISVAARSKAWVFGRSHAGIAGSNPAGVLGVSYECCVLSGEVSASG